MILVDTSIWVDHFRAADPLLDALLRTTQALMHPCVLGELALGGLRSADPKRQLLTGLPVAKVATPDDVLYFIINHNLSGKGIGYVDAHLLASARISTNTTLWTRDMRLNAVAHSLGVAAPLAAPLAGLH